MYIVSRWNFILFKIKSAEIKIYCVDDEDVVSLMVCFSGDDFCLNFNGLTNKITSQIIGVSKIKVVNSPTLHP